MVRAKSAAANEWSVDDANRNSERATTTISGPKRGRDFICFGRATNHDATDPNAAAGIPKSRAKSGACDRSDHGF